MTEPTTTDEARAALHAALAKAQGEFPPIAREKTVRVQMKTGGSYEFAYAPLEQILAAVRPVLAKHGLAFVQRLEAPGTIPSLRSEILHADGGSIAASFPLGELPASPQQLGSLITYLRRYAATCLLGIAAEEDDDGQQAADTAQTVTFQAPASVAEQDPFDGDDRGADTISDAQRKKIYALKAKLTKAEIISDEVWSRVMSGDFGTETITELTKAQASTLIERLVKAEQEIPA